ncbi:hypothetical protein RQN30_10365 [Arcanobacterium hippocoleae]
MFGKSGGDAYRARHKVVVGPKYSKFGIKSAMVSSLFALGIPAGSANAVDDSNSVLTEESINIVANSLENTPNTTTTATADTSVTPKKRAKRQTDSSTTVGEELPPSRNDLSKTKFVDISGYTLVWDENITLNGQKVGPLPGGRKDPGFKKISDTEYVYYYDFNTPFNLDMGEVMKRIKAVPKDSSDKPTYYGRDIFNPKVKKVSVSYPQGGRQWSVQEFKNSGGQAVDVVYHEAQGSTNRRYNNVAGTPSGTFNSIIKKI